MPHFSRSSREVGTQTASLNSPNHCHLDRSAAQQAKWRDLLFAGIVIGRTGIAEPSPPFARTIRWHISRKKGIPE